MEGRGYLSRRIGTLSGFMVLHVDGPEGEAEPRKYCHPPNPKVRSAGVLHRYFKGPNHEIKTVEYVSLPA